jgi:hypothetical protein
MVPVGDNRISMRKSTGWRRLLRSGVVKGGHRWQQG